MKRRRKWIVRIVVLLLVLCFCWMQNKYLTITHYTYNSVKLPEEFEGYRIVQVSDLHNASFGWNNKRLISKLEDLAPDMIVITGDVVDSSRTNLEVAIDFAKQTVEIAPTYYITGNHENWLEAEEKEYLLESLKEAGVICLEDELTEVWQQEESIILLGLNDESLAGSRLNMLLLGEESEQLQILLAHEPQYLDNYADSGVDLVLTGHAHGGQFRIPFVGGVVAPDQGLFPKYTEGVHVQGSTTMIISRGLGNSVIPLRLFNLPEIVCVDLNVEK